MNCRDRRQQARAVVHRRLYDILVLNSAVEIGEREGPFAITPSDRFDHRNATIPRRSQRQRWLLMMAGGADLFVRAVASRLAPAAFRRRAVGSR
jgi:hypothetical protein